MNRQTFFLTVALMAGAAFSAAAFAQAASDAGKEAAGKEPAVATAPALPQLSPERAKLYDDMMRQAADGNKEVRAQIRKAHDDADAIVMAEKFDKKAFLAKAAEIDKLYDTARDTMNNAFISVAEKFTQEERKILVRTRNERRRQ